MNRAKKKKVEVPSLLEVRLLLSGHAPEPSPEPTPIATELQKEPSPPCVYKMLVQKLRTYAREKQEQAERAQRAYVKAGKQFEVDERIREVAWRKLDAARRSTVYSVLEKREQKMHRLRLELVQSAWVLETARADNAEAQFEAEAYKCAAKDAEIDLLKRSLQRANKS